MKFEQSESNPSIIYIYKTGGTPIGKLKKAFRFWWFESAYFSDQFEKRVSLVSTSDLEAILRKIKGLNKEINKWGGFIENNEEMEAGK